MSWENLILSNNSSIIVKESINKINKDTEFNGKYIGIIPLYWNEFEIYQQNQLRIEKYKNKLMTNELLNDTENPLINMNNLEIDEIVKKIYTNKTKLILNREFYYLSDKDNLPFYPVYQFPDNIQFTLRNIQQYIIKKLSLEECLQNTYDIFRIYKMSGFHLFVLLTSEKIKFKLNYFNNLEWKINKGLELLSINDNEIINSFMKISNDKFIHNLYDTNWLQKMNGILVSNDKNIIIPYEVNWYQIISTLANFIDNESNDNLHLYFKAHIIIQKKNMLDIFYDLHKQKNNPNNMNDDE